MIIDSDRVIADLDELAAASGGRFGGAKRVAWTDGWRAARLWLQERLKQLPVTVTVDAAGNLWAEMDGGSAGCSVGKCGIVPHDPGDPSWPGLAAVGPGRSERGSIATKPLSRCRDVAMPPKPAQVPGPSSACAAGASRQGIATFVAMLRRRARGSPVRAASSRTVI